MKIKLSDVNVGRREFLSVSSMALGAGMLANPASRLVKAVGAPATARAAESDGTKYGKYITFADNNDNTERGVQLFPNIGSYDGFAGIIAGRMLPPGPMPDHPAPEQHRGEIEYLIHLGNDPEDPLKLDADVELYLGKGKWLEKHEIRNTTAVYLPDGMWHCPWKVKKIRTALNWVNVRIGEAAAGGGIPGAEGGAPGGAPGGAQDGPPQVEGLSEKEKAAAKTSNFVFDRCLLSGVPKDMKDPVGGEWIAYTDCTKMAGGALTRIIRYRPEKAPYNIIDRQTHEYGSLFFFLGMDLEDARNFDAKIELLIGPEKEKHIIDKTAVLYVPANTPHGPFRVTSASGPFNFLEIVAGPELPGTVQG